MRRLLCLFLLAGVLLGGCGYFREKPAATGPQAENPLIPKSRRGFARPAPAAEARQLLHAVVEGRIDPTRHGVILSASGISAQQGAYDARLELSSEATPETGMRSYRFVARQPQTGKVGLETARTLRAARHIDAKTMADLRGIRIITQTNALVVRP